MLLKLNIPITFSIVLLLFSATGNGQTNEIKIRFIGNCGLHLTDGNTHIYTDFPYKSGAHHYMEYDPTEIDNLQQNAYYLFTHKHSDHYLRWKMNGVMKAKNGKKYGMCDFSFAEELHIPSKYYANDEWFEIAGSKGIIFIHRCTGDIHTGPAVSVFTSKGWKYYDKVKSDWVEGFKGAAENFISAIDGKEAPLLTGVDGKEILKMSFAIYESAKRRRDVFLDELEKTFPTLYAKKRIRKEKRESYITSFKSPLFGKDFSKYAPQAKKLTEDFMERFDPEAAQDWEGVVGLVLSAEGGVAEQKFTIKIGGGKAKLISGEIPENAGITLTMPAGSWAAIILGKKRIETALFKGELKIDGEAMEGMKLRSAFRI